MASIAGVAALLVPSVGQVDHGESRGYAVLAARGIDKGDRGVSSPRGGMELPGVAMERHVAIDVSRPVSISWPRVPGADALSTMLEEWTAQQERQFLRETVAGGLQPPELSIDGEVVQAVGSVVAVSMRVQRFGAGPTQTTVATFYAEVPGGVAWAGDDLITESARGQLADAVMAAVRTAYPDKSIDRSGAQAALGGALLTAGGDLTLSLAVGADVAEVALPALQVRPALSQEGLRVLAVLAENRPYAVPAGAAPSPVPAAEAVTSPAATPTPPVPGPSPAPPVGRGPVDCAVAACVALTYDDGPSIHTPRLLDALTAANAKATFFVLGRSVTAYPDVVRREVELGMALGNHTWSHRDMRRLTHAELRSELDTTNAAVASVVGSAPTIMRPPYGAFDDRTRALGMPIIRWDVDSEDWRHRSAAITTQRVLSAVRPGSIVLMHDIHPSTVDATPGIIAALQARGFVLVTVPELLGSTQSGLVYFSRAEHR
ncbi:MAG: polysaccharide deacetylase family protein [Dermatophilaceae bacterium]